MYRVLMPIDTDDDRVTAQTDALLTLANVPEGLEVTLLHVFSNQDRADETVPSQLASGSNAGERLTEHGITVKNASRAGKPAEEILDVAREIGCDMIILGGRKRSTLGMLVFGSVSHDVMLNATQPVMITGSAQQVERPSHRCANCGETYYTTPATEISKCRRCGGVHVEKVEAQ